MFLQVSQQQLYALSVNYEQLRVSKSQEITTDIDNNEIAAVKAQLENTKKSLEGVQSEQEDLLGNIPSSLFVKNFVLVGCILSNLSQQSHSIFLIFSNVIRTRRNY